LAGQNNRHGLAFLNPKEVEMKKWIFSLFFSLVMFTCCQASGSRIKDLTEFQGVRDNQLVGYGIVVGLNDTGDTSKVPVTGDSVANMLEHLGINVDDAKIKGNNVASVIVTADLPAFAKVGVKMDVLVSSLGDAESLSGGTLLRTPLIGPDQKVYALAQGPVIVGGFSLGGRAAKVEKNHPTVGRIPGGGLVEREVGFSLGEQDRYILNLREADFTTISRMAAVVNSEFGEDIAYPMDSRSLTVQLPAKFKAEPVEFLSRLENLNVESDGKAKIVINERTGTIVIGSQVRLSTVAVAHGDIKLAIKESAFVSQPPPFNRGRGGETVVVPDTDAVVQEDESRFVVMYRSVRVGYLASALNALGVTPRDVIAILQAIKAAGALQAELVVL
jgi:flagellar P-ring protein precursor FlgI